MEKRIGIVAILADNRDSICTMNSIFSDYHDIIRARQGLPFTDKNIQIISLIVEGTTDQIGALTGKLGRLPGLKVKSMLTTYRENDESGNTD
ncbi:TM1266 family iron-only hydrogenase system putative regulator [Spirochaeta isovalerica]|uniref:Putative iron-only hydrogenase system regulator n=1 Tax=Spirochaeta isovalerica TaxID=150 RepID=A0A841R729_9SPIO|nr:TM1266 family iron-only hydrogenase system putative regulator [Spirochaeta isovalerica]MBB6478568.1 putative iron-only hydrogenase system regulator [Spirochaeta isovalerica]